MQESARRTVMVVDDEKMIRDLCEMVLRSSGFEVISAASGREALHLLETIPGSPDLVLSDVIMPDMSGPDMVRQVIRIRPGIRVMFMSGYGSSETLPPLHDGASAMLMKPFTSERLLNAVLSMMPDESDVKNRP